MLRSEIIKPILQALKAEANGLMATKQLSGAKAHLLFVYFISFWLHHLALPLGNHFSSTLSPCGTLANQGLHLPGHVIGSGLGMCPHARSTDSTKGLTGFTGQVPVPLPPELLADRNRELPGPS